MHNQYPTVFGPLGDASKGEIQIVTDPVKIKEIEEAKKQKIGVLAETPWQIWICDPVQFADGSYGTYTRILWKQALKEGTSGAAVLPILPDGRILLICNYRHPLRKWSLEIPRGNTDGLEQINQIAKRELKEETGAIGEVTYLGKVNADSGITPGGIAVVRVDVQKFGKTNREPAEVSITLHAFTREELKKAIQQGYAEVKVQGVVQKVEIADSFTFAALYLDLLQKS